MSYYKVTITTPSGKEVYSEKINAKEGYQAVFAAALEYHNSTTTKLVELGTTVNPDLVATKILIGAFRDLRIDVDYV